MKVKTLRKYTLTLYVWRDFELSQMTWMRRPMWNFCRSGSLKKLPDGKDSKMFSSLAEANEYVAKFGFKIAGLVPSEALYKKYHEASLP
jgi:hypothetical protein